LAERKGIRIETVRLAEYDKQTMARHQALILDFYRFEVATTKKKTQLIGWRSQLCRNLLDCYRKIEVAFALGAIKHRGKLEGFLLDAVQDLHPVAYAGSITG
jgi:hypothetical protein